VVSFLPLFTITFFFQMLNCNPMSRPWQATEMGSRLKDPLKHGGITPETSASSMLKIIESATKESSATFYKYDGETMPW
jgi:hypothetical protein